VRADPDIPPPPEDPDELLAWAEAHAVASSLDSVLVGGNGPAGTFLPGRDGEALSYRQILIDGAPKTRARGGRHDAAETARSYLHRLAVLMASHRAARAWIDEHGRDPEDAVLSAFLDRLRRGLRDLVAGGEAPGLSPGTYERVRVRVASAPAPRLSYEEHTLTGPRGPGAVVDEISLLLLGWSDDELRWGRHRGNGSVAGEIPVDLRRRALEAMIDFVRDPRAAGEHELLTEQLRLPAWQFALGTLDESLSRLAADDDAGAAEERIAFRVHVLGDGALNVEPVLQRRGAGGAFSRGARLQWFQLPERKDLSPAARRAFAAYDDRFARRTSTWGGPLAPAQVFGILLAPIHHPAVFLDGAREEARLDLRQGRLRLRFVTASDGGVTPLFDLLGVTLLPGEVDQSLRDEH
jgi:hypothetical protein